MFSWAAEEALSKIFAEGFFEDSKEIAKLVKASLSEGLAEKFMKKHVCGPLRNAALFEGIW